MAILSFDWDDVSIDNKTVQQALCQLTAEYGPEMVWYRVSSSGQGLHVLVAGIDEQFHLRPVSIPETESFRWRTHFFEPPYELECGGRLRADNERCAHGFSTGRLFSHKNQTSAGEWIPFITGTHK